MRPLWRYFLNLGRKYDRQPGKFFGFLLHSLKYLHLINTFAPYFDVEHYLQSNRKRPCDQILTKLSGIVLLIVAAPKDFVLLEDCISHAIASQTNINWSKVSVVVPLGSEIDAKSYCRNIPVPIEVVPESNFFDNSEVRLLRESFKDRAGWVIQQLIKVRYIYSSNASGVLVIDCDTLLLKPRNWINEQGLQTLFVSEEYNQNYHYFLEYLSLKPQRAYTFISHHMFYQPIHFKSMLQRLNFSHPDDQIQKILNYPLKDAISPFSLDYELYGQWILQKELGVLNKWSNIEIDRNTYLRSGNRKRQIQMLGQKWASVSLHSWRLSA